MGEGAKHATTKWVELYKLSSPILLKEEVVELKDPVIDFLFLSSKLQKISTQT